MVKNGATTDHNSRLITGHHKDELIEADGAHFENATLENCIIVYGGGDSTWEGLIVKNCTFRFIGSAQKTVNFLKGFQSAKKMGVIDLADLQTINDLEN